MENSTLGGQQGSCSTSILKKQKKNLLQMATKSTGQKARLQIGTILKFYWLNFSCCKATSMPSSPPVWWGQHVTCCGQHTARCRQQVMQCSQHAMCCAVCSHLNSIQFILSKFWKFSAFFSFYLGNFFSESAKKCSSIK